MRQAQHKGGSERAARARQIGNRLDLEDRGHNQRAGPEHTDGRLFGNLPASFCRLAAKKPVSAIGKPVFMQCAGDEDCDHHAKRGRKGCARACHHQRGKNGRPWQGDDDTGDRRAARRTGKIRLFPRIPHAGDCKAREKPQIICKISKNQVDKRHASGCVIALPGPYCDTVAQIASTASGRLAFVWLAAAMAGHAICQSAGLADDVQEKLCGGTIPDDRADEAMKDRQSPFEDIRAVLARLPGPDLEAAAAVRARDAQLTKPPGSLGRLEELAQWYATWRGGPLARPQKILVAIFASSHGIAARGVSAFPPAVTQQMVENFAAGGAAINQLCTLFDLGLKVVDLAVAQPTPDITIADAMDEAACAATLAYGMEVVEPGLDLLCLGEMGIGNTAVAAAVYCALYGGDAAGWTGPGTGLDGQAVARKAAIVARAVARLGGVRDPLHILRRAGGREIAALAGAIIAARQLRVPVLIDGFVASAAAALLHAIDAGLIDHCRFGHLSAERAHGEVLRRLGARPLLALDMRLGEATGAALAACLVRAALATHLDMATFAEAGIAGKTGTTAPQTP